MKKNTLKAFTLVEMLIVIVIIGILIAALMPRMQAAQGRARDVSRKTALSQIQSAIATSQADKGEWPNATAAAAGIEVSKISTELQGAGMSLIPTDPLKTNEVSGLGNTTLTGGEYGYIVTKRSGKEAGGFVLMAVTEVEGGSNWIYCDGTNGTGKITSGTDISKIVLCSSFQKNTGSNQNCQLATTGNNGLCKYNKDSELRYIVLY